MFELETGQMKRDEETSELPAQFVMLLNTAKLSRPKLKAIFDKRQWVVMSALIKQLEEGVNAVGEFPVGEVQIIQPAELEAPVRAAGVAMTSEQSDHAMRTSNSQAIALMKNRIATFGVTGWILQATLVSLLLAGAAGRKRSDQRRC